MSKLKAGVVGCGGIAINKHIPSAIQTGLIDFVGFCDIVKENAEKTCKEFGIKDAKVYADFHKMLDDKSIDVIYVCTSNRTHCEFSVAALKAGKHVICEKPMAINAKEAKMMLDAANETGKLLTIAYQNRFNPEYEYTKKFADDGGFGDIYFARAKALRRRAVPTWGNFLDKEEQGGGPLIDIGTHALDLTLWTMNNYKPKYVVGTVYQKLIDQKDTGNAWGDWDTKKFKVEDSAFGFIVMENGATIILESAWALNDRFPQEAAFTLSGTKAGVDFQDGLFINHIQNGRQAVTEVKFPGKGVPFTDADPDGEPGYKEQLAFLNAVLGKGELVVKPEQAYIVTLILEGIYESARTGKPVYF